MTARGEIETFVGSMVADHLGVSPEEITPTRPFDDMGADSLDRVEMIMAAEEEFGIMVDDAAAEKVVDVATMTDAIVEACKTQLTTH